MNFSERVRAAYQDSGSVLVIGIAPRLDQMPLPMQRYDDPFLPYGRAIIEATNALVCGYAFHLGAYLALGAAGAIALERTLAAVPNTAIKLLHAPFVTADYVRASYEDAFNADAVTLATLDASLIAAYTQQPAHGVFVRTLDEAERDRLAEVNNIAQVGSYQAVGETQYTLRLLDESLPPLHWYWGKPIFAARGEDFREVIRATTLDLRQTLTPHP
jgi:hypothetical protein